MIGTSLGPYKVIEQLGAGGMGEVYLGEDTRLGRKVAIKVLPAEFASDPERLARFEQEARAAAALNHPHIAVVHDVGSEGETHFIVQEYLEGQSLRERLDKGALPLDEALDLATEVGEALIAAHKAGIIHRDLKPDNIFVTEEDHAKVLDFGLAKLTEMVGPAGSVASMSPTMLGTVAGQVMGTVGYMAPEQVEGAPDIDQRADLFAFGCVLYEMVSGRQAFSGKSVVQTLNRIAHEEPEPLSTIVAGAPAELQRIVKKCLAKEPAKRYQSAGDLIVDLQSLATELEAGAATPVDYEPVAVPDPVGSRSLVLVGLVGFVLGTVVVGVLAWSLTRPSPRPPTKLAVTLTPPRFGQAGPPLVAISPDGRTVAFTGLDQLYRRDMEHLEVVPIPGTEGGNTPFFSPDGRWLGFQGARGVEKVSLTGGPPVTLCESSVRGASWGVDDTIVFGAVNDGLWRVWANGSDCRPLTTLAEGEQAHWRPDILPDGTAALFTVWSGSLDTAQLAVVELDSGERRMLGVSGTYPRYAHTGHLIFARQGSLWAVPFDAARRQVTGTPAPVMENVSVEATSGAAQFDLADDGSLLYMPGGTSANTAVLVWVDREGREEILPAPGRAYRDPTISPDGTRIAVTVAEENTDVYVWDMARQTLGRFTFHEARDGTPVWSPDGTRLVFSSDRDSSGLFVKASDGTGEIERLVETTALFSAMTWSEDDRLVFYGQGEIGVAAVGAEGAAPESLFPGGNLEIRPALSPDGRWLAYQAAEGGQFNVVVRPFPIDSDAQWQVSTGFGYEPKWGPDGKELFYLGPQGMMAVQIETEPTFSHSPPRALFSVEGYRFGKGARRYAISPDGNRFLMLKPESAPAADSDDSPGLVIVLDWFEELKRLVPAER